MIFQVDDDVSFKKLHFYYVYDVVYTYFIVVKKVKLNSKHKTIQNKRRR